MYYRALPASTGQPTAGPRQGVVLLAVLVVLVLLSLAAYQYSELMTAEYKAADSYARSVQATALADSGIHYAAALLSNPDAVANTLNGNPYDNPSAFQAVLVNDADSPRARGRFSILAPVDPGDSAGVQQAFRYGVVDEAGKINLNALFKLDSSGKIAHDVLLALPNMTEDVVNAILDWLDPDSEPRLNGAENDYYSTLSPPYHCKNGPLDSLEELLLVKGMTPQLLFGNDHNRNGILDPEEDDGSGTLDRGLSAFLTVYSRELNLDSTGQPRIYINDNNLDDLMSKLTETVGQELANYIIAYRIYGPASTQSNSSSKPGSNSGGKPASGSGGSQGTPSGNSANKPSTGGGKAAGGSGRGGGGGTTGISRGSLNTRGGGQRRISSLYELVNSKVSIPSSDPNGQPTVYNSPLSDSSDLRELLPLLLDKVTTTQDTDIPGRVNINTAPQEVLAALPGLSSTDVQAIIGARPSPSSTEAPDPIFQTPAWLLTEANFPPEKLRTLEKYITARTQVYRVQALGYFDGGGPTARIEAVIDANGGRPRIIYWRNLTELGKGFNP
jgi:type II secretory pathway component PulK